MDSKRVLVTTIETTVEVGIPDWDRERQQATRYKVFGALNLHHYGSEEIPLSVQTADIPQALKDAHDRLRRPNRHNVTIRVYSDGTMEYEIRNPEEKK